MSVVVTILGSGSAGGVPRVGGGWGKCDALNPKNRRRRCSLLVQRMIRGATTDVIVDTSPDLREQLLASAVCRLDAILYTHEHADQTHGIDDIRPLSIELGRPITAFADQKTIRVLRERFGYCFVGAPGNRSRPFIRLTQLDIGEEIAVDGPAGRIAVTNFAVRHGDIEALGFRFGKIAYIPDVSAVPEDSMRHLAGLDLLIVDAMRYEPYETHFCVSDALSLIEKMSPRRAILTNMHSDLDYETLRADLPAHVEPAYDGMQITFPDPSPFG